MVIQFFTLPTSPRIHIMGAVIKRPPNPVAEAPLSFGQFRLAVVFEQVTSPFAARLTGNIPILQLV